ncbi:putative thiol:disulfide oxidoreductase, nitrite reductase complex assembly [Vibrio chagasii]|jgi:cytochrome c biogenesis protein CcmG/thiol:disulfide interchange protein DsbE|uniref:DsbE family thiol:disulfide interchange protein n=1 Tax=Vibrio chagasii TaxID=170679 RepID=UPI00336E2FE5|nr:putative thiol:disulfide oxidoreductase, nitrite reductase complex assembly [Vibrio chagasii]CAH6810889.1 putative thiol:disulfide oxidoreductase, nitrite reductase complex assembly [Vibrio chagasii]CAH6915843.1 putative thiol:disulfide oxidoreductase, nitrite reductase complex assembly [Vibrio chagasii]CAH6921261.1 putative thiol:disulfide oxidoreductase, nitrite reductase complex assembly [Vibrio chagasii]CAH6976536.1 putative thiol:disulfide oxidoreductase, nitrite reductase complex assem
MHTSVRNKLITLIVLALVLVLVFLFALDNKQQTTTVSIQQRAFPKFTSMALTDREGISSKQKLTLKDITEHPYQLVNVWASWCGICKSEHTYLLALRDKGIPIVGLNYRDNPAAAMNVLSSDGNPYTKVISDPQGKLALELGVIGTPETYLVDAKGNIVKKLMGVINESAWQDELALYFDGVDG